MKLNRKSVVAVVALGALALIAWPVYAHCGRCAGSAKDMVKAMDGKALTLAKAVSAAEAHSKGKPLSAVSTMKEDKVEVHVYSLVGEKIMECTVDESGKVIAMIDAKMLPGEHESQHETKPGKPGN